MCDQRPGLEVADWGVVGYGESVERQARLVEERLSGASPDRLVLVEHPPVVTLGRQGEGHDLRLPEEKLRARGVEVWRSARGGRATAHEPGQVVAYPVVLVPGRDLHAFVEGLLEAAGAVVRSFGVDAARREGEPGLWSGGGKIASIGLAVRRWVSYHGLALNGNNTLDTFGWIVPCGRPDERMTTLERELGRPVALDEVKRRFVEEFRRVFGYPGEPAGPRPAWLRVRVPTAGRVREVAEVVRALAVGTVCRSAHCPNAGECFSRGTATFLLSGPSCTRRCRFCAVGHEPPPPLDPTEPGRVAEAVRRLGLRHVVVTSVTRDDLDDGGAAVFARTVAAVREAAPGALVEVLVPDFGGSSDALDRVLDACPDVFNHNVETVPRLYPAVRPEADYGRSLGVLGAAAARGLPVKSGLMAGLGETRGEVRRTLEDLRGAGCTLLTLGQYLAPSPRHAPVARYLTPGEFEELGREARALGFRSVASGPLVRSSYRAGECFSGGER